MRIRKALSFLLAVLMLTLTLTGCMIEYEDEDEGGGSETVSQTAESGVISAEELAEYEIIRADQADEQTIAAASKLYSKLTSKYGVKMSFSTDYLGRNKTAPTDTKEILVGLTNRAETQGLRYLDYEIGYVNDRIVINGGSGKAVTAAVEDFLKNCLAEDALVVPASKKVERTYTMDGFKVNGELLKNFSVKSVEGSFDETLRAYLGEKVGIYSKSPEGKEIILKADSSYGVTELEVYLESGNLILSNSSALGDCSFVTDYFMDQVNKNTKSGEVNFSGKVAMNIKGCKSVTSEDVARLRAETDAKIASIRATGNMSIPSGKTIYYVSPNGSDSNNGKSQQTAWKTLNKVSSASLASGSYVCFERGGVYRGKLTAKSGVTYTAYGTGAKPILMGSPENGAGANASKWKKSDVANVWYYEGAEDWKDVGTLVFNEGESCAIKAIREWKDNGDIYNFTTGMIFNNGYKDLNQDLHFYHDPDTKRLYLYSKENPGTRFNSIEFNVGQSLIGISSGYSNITIDNLCLKYTGVHGIGAGNVTNLTVQNCEFAWIGGTVQGIIQGRTFETRYGNAIEVYGSCTNYIVKNNYIHQIYDAGITHQYSQVGSKVVNHTNVQYLNNVIEYCVYSIEYFVSGCEASNPSVMTDLLIEGNYMWYASRGFCEQRPPADRSWGAHIKGRCSATGNRAKNYIIRNNVFVDGKDRLLQITSNLYNTDGSDSMPTFSGNIYVEEYGRKFGQIEQSDTPYSQEDVRFDFNSVEYLAERSLGKSDGTDEFWFYKKK